MEEKCPLCSVEMEKPEEAGYLLCPHCRTRARFRGEDLVALDIPSYRVRLDELEKMNAELTGRIEEEGGRGEARDRTRLQALHLERQRVLSEYGFLACFSSYQEKWRNLEH